VHTKPASLAVPRSCDPSSTTLGGGLPFFLQFLVEPFDLYRQSEVHVSIAIPTLCWVLSQLFEGKGHEFPSGYPAQNASLGLCPIQ
jgi:hypothetical protein